MDWFKNPFKETPVLTEDDPEWGRFCDNGEVANHTKTVPVPMVTTEEEPTVYWLDNESFLSEYGKQHGGARKAILLVVVGLMLNVFFSAFGIAYVGPFNVSGTIAVLVLSLIFAIVVTVSVLMRYLQPIIGFLASMSLCVCCMSLLGTIVAVATVIG